MECPYVKKCGGCNHINDGYEKHLKILENKERKLLKKHGVVHEIQKMNYPYHYRNKVTASFGYEKGKIIAGTYQENSHRIVNIDGCIIENKKADEIIATIKKLAVSFKIKIYNEDTGYGLLRHVMVRYGHNTNEYMVVLILSSTMFPSKNNFVKALLKEHPEITTVVMNINNQKTSMILGERSQTIYGKGYINDKLCGINYRLSPESFYQINSSMTEKLYKKAIELADLKSSDKVIDAYSGIGTIGMTAAKKAGSVIAVELNETAVKDAIKNARHEKINNIRFVHGDAGKFMDSYKEAVDVVFMDPPRAGSSKEFLDSIVRLAPKRVVYISCNPETLDRDLKYLEKREYKVDGIWPYDMFPFTEHVETVVLMSKVNTVKG